MSLFTRSAVPTVLFAGLFHVAFATVIPSAVIGADDPTQITIKNLFLEPEYNEERIGVVRWSKKSATYYTLQAPAGGGKGRDLVSVDIASGEKKPLVTASEFIARDSTAPQDAVPLDIEDFELSEDETRVLLYTNSRRVWRRNTRGDYWVYDLRKRTLKKLGGDTPASTMMFAKFSPNGRQVAYVHQSNLYVQDVDSLAIQTLTKDGSETIINGTSDWVNEEELNIRDAFRWSPDSQQIVFWQFDTSEVPRLHLVNNTAGKYPELLTFPYPKVGERNSATRIGIIHVGAAFAQTNQANAVRWLNITGDPREHYIPHVEWSPDSKRLIAQQFNRLQTVNRLMQADPQTGVCQEIMAETDSAWLENDNPVRWFDNGRKLVWVSERSGWRHAYSVDLKERTVVPITTGEFDLIEIEAVDDAHGWLYFSASPDQPTERYLYRIRLSGGPMERVTPAPHKGWNTYQIAPSGDWATYAHSSFDSPPTVELIHLADHQTVRVLVDNAKLRARLAQLVEGPRTFQRIKINDGIELDSWCLMPPQVKGTAAHPLLVHVYGEPHGQTVRNMWPGSRGLWHRMLAQQGYVVVSVDNRGTMSPRGRAWRKSVHRQIGILASQEQAAAVEQLLTAHPEIDRNRVGVWGWSGGGSMSLNAIFRYPQLYKTAISVAPVPNQLLYDTIYQERYMGLPSENEAGYRDGSPITFAKQLQGNLLIIHGTGDDNCHYQGVELLINELIANQKQFDLLPYPNRSHSISEGQGTVPHFFTMMTRYLHDKLPL